MRTDPEFRAILEDKGIPTPEGTIINLRFVMGSSGWWAETNDGWLWFDDRTRIWKPSVYGPQ